MRKLMSKKGFTLVELMIVIVIMGILVAVAVPVYGAVTKNAQKKSCDANIRIIKENLSSYQMTGGEDGGQLTWEKMATASTNPTFLALFDGKALPKCPVGDAPYTLTVSADTGFGVYCSSTDPDAAKHIHAPTAGTP